MLEAVLRREQQLNSSLFSKYMSIEHDGLISHQHTTSFRLESMLVYRTCKRIEPNKSFRCGMEGIEGGELISPLNLPVPSNPRGEWIYPNKL